MRQENINLFKERRVEETKLPDDAIRLHAANALVDSCNRNKISNSEGEEFLSRADDYIFTDISQRKQKISHYNH